MTDEQFTVHIIAAIVGFVICIRFGWFLAMRKKERKALRLAVNPVYLEDAWEEG